MTKIKTLENEIKLLKQINELLQTQVEINKQLNLKDYSYPVYPTYPIQPYYYETTEYTIVTCNSGGME